MVYYNVPFYNRHRSMTVSRITNRLLLIGAVLILGGLAGDLNAKPLVVTSIKPLALLVDALAGTQVEVEVLLPPGSSPHGYQMRPSDRRKLAAADLILWVGPRMETFLAGVLDRAGRQTQTVALSHALRDLPRTNGTDTPSLSAGQFDRELDPHIWLDPRLIPPMVDIIGPRLARLPGIDRNRISRASIQFKAAFEASEQHIATRLSALKSVSLFAYHDAFRRYADGYGLPLAGILTLNPSRAPGARHLSDLQARLAAASAPCLVTEPEFSTRWWQVLTRDRSDARQVSWDPLATRIEPGPDAFIRFRQSMARSILKCALQNHPQ